MGRALSLSSSSSLTFLWLLFCLATVATAGCVPARLPSPAHDSGHASVGSVPHATPSARARARPSGGGRCQRRRASRAPTPVPPPGRCGERVGEGGGGTAAARAAPHGSASRRRSTGRPPRAPRRATGTAGGRRPPPPPVPRRAPPSAHRSTPNLRPPSPPPARPTLSPRSLGRRHAVAADDGTGGRVANSTDTHPHSSSCRRTPRASCVGSCSRVDPPLPQALHSPPPRATVP